MAWIENKNRGRGRDSDGTGTSFSDQGILVSVFIHFAQRTARIFRPFSYRVTFWRFGRNVREVALLDHGRFRPKVVFLPQCAHLAITLSFHLICPPSLEMAAVLLAGKSYHNSGWFTTFPYYDSQSLDEGQDVGRAYAFG